MTKEILDKRLKACFIACVLAVLRDLPEYFGKPNTIYKAYQRWFRSNKLMALFTLLIKDADLEWVFIDGTTHDVKVAPDLLDKVDLSDTEVLCADKGYDSDALRAHIEQAGTHNNIPRKRNTKSSNDHMDWDLYKTRHLVENAFAKLKQYRAVATRFDKLKQSYENTVALACAYIWLKL